MTTTQILFGVAIITVGLGVSLWWDRRRNRLQEAAQLNDWHVSHTIRTLRLRRHKTGSWVYVTLPYAMTEGEAEAYAASFHKGWEIWAAVGEGAGRE